MALRKFSADLPNEVVERFDEFVEMRGLMKRRAVGAALDFLRAAPADLRDLLMSGDVDAAAKYMDWVNGAIHDNAEAFDVKAFRMESARTTLDVGASDEELRQRAIEDVDAVVGDIEGGRQKSPRTPRGKPKGA